MAKIIKSQGTTKSERYLAKLGEKSFLNLWSYPNVYRNQDQRNGGDGTEVCDLLVVCGDHVIIFSDKTVEFPDTKKIELDWKRWVKRAVIKSANQLFGAERWLNYPDRLFIDSKCTQTFPIKFPPTEKRQVHLVVVALGAGDRCKKYFSGGSGSLRLLPQLKENDHINVNSSKYHPFAIGDIKPDRTFVHVFDDVTLDILLVELDTITDLVNYLDKKEKFFRSGHLMGATGEEELLSDYLRHANEKGEHGFFPPSGILEWKDDEFLFVHEGHWEEFKNHPQYIAKKEANKISYFWDNLITAFTNHIIAGTTEQFDEEGLTVRELESGGVRFMALESRFNRRILSEQFTDAIKEVPENSKFVRVVPPIEPNGTAYIFIQLPFISSQDLENYENYRTYRKRLLEAYCIVINAKHKTHKRVVGVAIEPPKFVSPKDLTSEDLFLFEIEEWTEEMETLAKNLQKEFNIMESRNIKYTHYSAQEYPETIPFSPTSENSPTEPTASNRAERRRLKAKQRKLDKKNKKLN